MEQDFFNSRREDGDVVYLARLPLEVASNRKLHCCVGIAILQRGEKYALAVLPHDSSDMWEDATTDGELLTAYEYDTISPLCDCICGGYFVGHSGGVCGLLHLMATLAMCPLPRQIRPLDALSIKLVTVWPVTMMRSGS